MWQKHIKKCLVTLGIFAVLAIPVSNIFASVAGDFTVNNNGTSTHKGGDSAIAMELVLPNPAADTSVAGLTVAGTAGVATFPAGWNLYGVDAAAGAAFAAGSDWIGTDDDSDGVYTAAADSLIINNTDAPTAGDTLYDMGATDYFMDSDHDVGYDNAEAWVLDDGDGYLTKGALNGTGIDEVLFDGPADIIAFTTEWVMENGGADNDGDYNDGEAIVDGGDNPDSSSNILHAGKADVTNFVAGDNVLFDGGAEWDTGTDDIFIDLDNDDVYTSAADTIYITGSDTPTAGDTLYDVTTADNVCSDNSDLASATCVYIDTGGVCGDGTEDTHLLGAADCDTGGDALVGTADNWAATDDTIDTSTNFYKEETAEELTYSSAADTVLYNGSGTLSAGDAGTEMNSDPEVVFLDSNHDGDYDSGEPLVDVGNGNTLANDGDLATSGHTFLTRASGSWTVDAVDMKMTTTDLGHVDVNNDAGYNDGEPIIREASGAMDANLESTDTVVTTGTTSLMTSFPAGYAKTDSTSDTTTNVYNEDTADEHTYSAAADTLVGGVAVSAGDTLVNMNSAKPGDWSALLINDGGVTGTWEAGSDMIFNDVDGSDYYNADALNSILFGNTGTCTDSDIASFAVFEDTNGNGSYDSGVDTMIAGNSGSPFIGTSMAAAGSVYTTGSNEQTIFFAVTFAASPTHGCTFTSRLPNTAGAPYAARFDSGDDGPTDANVDTTDTITIDTAPPTVSAVFTDTSLIIGETSLVTFTFNEVVTGFDNSDLSIANGTLTPVADQGAGVWTATFTPTVSVEDATNVVTVDMTGVTDVAGNAGVGTTDSNNYAIDTLAPTLSSVTITTTDAAFDANMASEGNTVQLSFTSSEALSGTPAVSDVTLDGNNADAVNNPSGNNYTATRVIQLGDTEGTLAFTIDFEDAAGNAGTQVTAVTAGGDVTVDTTDPTVDSVTPNTTTISDSLVGSDTFWIDIDYDDAMGDHQDPVVTLTPDLVSSGILTLSATSNWTSTSNGIYRVYYDVADTNQEITLTDIDIDNGEDHAGNPQVVYNGGGSGISVDTLAPSGYSVTLDQDPINSGNETAVSFTFAGAEVGATYNYSIDDVSGSGPIASSGVIATATDQISGINLSSLLDETITLTVYLTDTAGNQGSNVTDTASKDVTSPNLTTWDLDLSGSTLTMNFDESVNTSTLDVTAITVQDAVTATTSYALTDSTTASVNGTQVVIALSATDLAAIIADFNLATSAADSYLVMTAGTIDDLAGNDVTAIADGAADQVTNYTAAVPGDLTSASVTLSPTAINAPSDATIAFTNERVIPVDGKILITFPAGFDLTNVTTATSSVVGGTLSVGVAGQVVTITRSGGSIVTASTDVEIVIFNLTNPSTAGATGTYTFQTQTSGASVIDENISVTGDTITSTTTPPAANTGGTTGGGGGGGDGQTSSTSNTRTSTIASDIDGTIEGDISYSRPVEFQPEIITVDQDNNTATVQATGEDGSLTIKPNSKSTIFLEIPSGTTITGEANWSGRIDPPLVRSLTKIHPSGETVEGTDDLLERADVAVLVEVGGNTPLNFSNDLTLTIPVDLPDGSVISIYTSNDGNTWIVQGTAVVQNGIAVIMTDHLTYFALKMTDETAEMVEEMEEIEEAAYTFEDIVGHWAADYIEEIADKGVVSGKSEGMFAPNDYITRAELTKIATKAFGIDIDPVATYSPFGDVETAAWYAPYVIAAKESGVVAGYENGSFSPNGNVNRAEALKILLEAAGIENVAEYFDTNYSHKDWTYVYFMDVGIDAWFAPYVTYAKDTSIVSGYTEDSFAPGNNITRAEVAKIVVKILEMME